MELVPPPGWIIDQEERDAGAVLVALQAFGRRADAKRIPRDQVVAQLTSPPGQGYRSRAPSPSQPAPEVDAPEAVLVSPARLLVAEDGIETQVLGHELVGVEHDRRQLHGTGLFLGEPDQRAPQP